MQRGKKHRQETLLFTPGMGCKNSLEETKSIICELVTEIFTGTAKLSRTSNRSFKPTIKETQHCYPRKMGKTGLLYRQLTELFCNYIKKCPGQVCRAVHDTAKRRDANSFPAVLPAAREGAAPHRGNSRPWRWPGTGNFQWPSWNQTLSTNGTTDSGSITEPDQ